MQLQYFLRFLSVPSILGIVTLSALYTLFILINWVAPDLLILGQ
ncbi:hypothetical protein ACQ4M3_33835 [Leptolyngbya sp. AN03gr2]